MRRLAPAIALLLLLTCLGLAWLAYSPGLHGSFLFDDFANLPALGASGPVDHWATFWRYITSGRADPTGRPLAMLSFLADAHDWPAAPYPFKRGNLILHLFNGLLLAGLLRKLGRSALSETDAKRIDCAAALGATFWLLHPLFVSTTLYIVQREAMLPATFVLLGLLSWLCGRDAMLGNRSTVGWIWIVLGLGGCTLLGVLSKANGILLPALALVIEYTLFRSACAPLHREEQTRSTGYRRAMLLFAWLPAAAVAAYLLYVGWNGLVHGISVARPWTLSQRLLTEPRIVMDYLGLLWLPRPFTPGLFNDHIAVSTSLWAPATTLPALLAVLGLIATAWRLRHWHPAFAAAVLFYFVGQSLESSTIALELYFEHRNYLPAMLMFWPLALWLCSARRMDASRTTTPIIADKSSAGLDWAKAALTAVLVLGLGLMTHARAALWGNTHDRSLLWAALNPDSPRAQANAAQMEISAGHPALAVARLKPLLAQEPSQAQLALNLFAAECKLGHVDSTTVAATDTALRNMRDPGSLLTSWFTRVIDHMANPPCPELDATAIRDMLDAVDANAYLKTNTGRQQDLYYLRGRLALAQGKAHVALANFDHALDLQVRPAIALNQAALLGSHGFPREGLAHLDHYDAVAGLAELPGVGMPQLHAWILKRQQYWPKEMAHLRATLQGDAGLQPTDAP